MASKMKALEIELILVGAGLVKTMPTSAQPPLACDELCCLIAARSGCMLHTAVHNKCPGGMTWTNPFAVSYADISAVVAIINSHI